jgi:hypothetical protein
MIVFLLIRVKKRGIKNMIEITEVGKSSLEVIQLLDLPLSEDTPIYIGTTNIAHMAQEHRYEFNRFYDKIPLIISSADYVRLKKDDGSIEYIKSFGKYIKLAVRIAGDGKYYARSLYRVRDKIVKRLIKIGDLKPLTKE